MNTVEVRLYAGLRKYGPRPDGAEALSVSLDDEAKLSDLFRKLKLPEGEIALAMVNGSLERADHRLYHQDRVALFPLVAGG